MKLVNLTKIVVCKVLTLTMISLFLMSEVHADELIYIIAFSHTKTLVSIMPEKIKIGIISQQANLHKFSDEKNQKKYISNL